MADEFQVNITGIEETCEALSSLPAAVVKGALVKALTAASVVVVRTLRPRVPSRNNLFDEEAFKTIEGSAVSGTLVDALMTDIAINSSGKGGTAQIGFGKMGYIARQVEFGHRIIGHKPRKIDKGKTVPPHPFMRPAAAASGESAIEAFAESLAESVDAGIPGVRAA